VLYAVTKLNSVDVRSLCSCTVCGRMSLSSVVCLCVYVPGVSVLVKSGHKKIIFGSLGVVARC
jgi:hypothetical protein